jgi:thiol-disulfide isomerase/thioredoxin
MKIVNLICAFLFMTLVGCATLGTKTVYEKPVYATEETYVNEISENYNATIVVVGADWCPPCRTAKAKLKAMLTEYPGDLKFVVLDTEKYNADTLEGKDIQYIPYFIVYNNGERIFEGNENLDKIVSMLEKAMQE